MPPTFPCPNPACTQVFNPEAVQGTASLKCPRCGTVFQFRQEAPKPAAKPTAKTPVAKPAAKPAPPPLPKPAGAAPPAAKPAAKPPSRPVPAAKPAKPVSAAPPPLPTAVPVAQVAPLAAPVTSGPPSGLLFGSQPDVVLASRPHRRRVSAWLVPVVVFGVATIVGIVVITWAVRSGFFAAASGGDDEAGIGKQGNFSFKPPGGAWQHDRGLQIRFLAPLVFRKKNPSSALAIDFKDYEKRLPSDAEMIDDALTRLKAYFNDVEYEAKPRSDDNRLGDQPALVLEFQGEDPEHVLSNGQVWMLAYRGRGYWFYTWGPLNDRESLSGEWATLRGDFALGDQRPGWTVAPPKTAVFQGNKLPYKLVYAESVWKKVSPDGYDKQAEVVLIGHDPRDKEGKLAGKDATVQALVLDKAADLNAAVKAARDYVLEMQKGKQGEGNDYNYPDTAIDVIKEKSFHNVDNDVDLGAFRGHVAKLEVKNTPNLRHYVVLGIVKMDDGVLVVSCECAWDRRDYWEQEFTPLLEKLAKSGKGR